MEVIKCAYCDNTLNKNNVCGKCHSVSYCDREHQVKDWSNHKLWCNKPYKLENIEGKGKGLIATKNIKRGECIIEDTALVILTPPVTERDIEIIVSTLTVEQQKIYYGLSYDSQNKKSIAYNIFNLNALPLGKDSKTGGLFPVVSRINHSCNPNVHHSWNDNLKKETIFATRDINSGDEILTTYIPLYATRDERNKVLQEQFMFTCHCDICSLTDEALLVSDKRRKRIEELDEEIKNVISTGKFKQGITKVQQSIKLLEDEHIDDLALYYRCEYDAFQACHASNDKRGMRYWIKCAYDHALLVEGSYSDTTIKFRDIINSL